MSTPRRAPRPRVTLAPADADRARAILAREIAAGTVKAVADRLGDYTRTAVSQVANGTYPGRPDAVLARVLAVFETDAIECPHLSRPLTRPECREFAGRPMPTASRSAFAHWDACQSCQHRGEPCPDMSA